MPNQVNLQVCKFVDYYTNGTVKTFYGYRIFDDYEQDYSNIYDSLQHVLDEIGTTPEKILQFIDKIFPVFLDTILHSRGLRYNGEWVEIQPEDVPKTAVDY